MIVVARALTRPASRVVCVSLVVAASRGACASPSGEAISQQVQIDTYQHYLEDLLYTHLGDNRGYGPEHDLARENIQSTLESFGLTVALEPFTYNNTTYYNVVATQDGTDYPGQIIVVGAHFDSVNNPGADDNATGTAVVMETARVLSQNRSAKTIKYVLFDREEQGRRGSSAFVSAHSGENITMALTADMIGHDSGFYAMDIYATPASSAVINGVDSAIDTYGGGLDGVVNMGNYGFSDHWSFELAGIPACVIIERCYQCNPYYHTPNDAVDVEPGYISYPLIEALLHSVVGYLVDEIGIVIYGDLDADGSVGILDLLALLSNWGPCAKCVSASCPADLDSDCAVGILDLLTLLANWG